MGLRRQFSFLAELNRFQCTFLLALPCLWASFIPTWHDEHRFFSACFKINTDNLSIMSCLFGKLGLFLAFHRCLLMHALTHNYRCNFNDYLSICVKLGEKAPKHGHSCANTMKVLIWTRRSCWHAGGSSFISWRAQVQIQHRESVCNVDTGCSYLCSIKVKGPGPVRGKSYGC